MSINTMQRPRLLSKSRVERIGGNVQQLHRLQHLLRVQPQLWQKFLP